ncbi:MAG: PAS domain S-box protein [Pseudomonadota bacterium]
MSNAAQQPDFARALEAAPIGIVVTDPTRPDNPITYVNDEFCAITGYAADEVVGRNPRFLQGPGSDPAEVARMRVAIARGEPVTAELLNFRKDGRPFFMKIDIRPIRGGEGGVTAFVGGLTDMTGQRAAQERLAESEERLRAVMAAIPLPMLTLRMDGTIARANDAAHETLGVAPGELPGRSAFDFVLPDPADPGRQLVRDALAGTGEARRVEMRARRADGGLLWVLVSARRFTVRGETRTLAIFQDVTDLKRKERELTEANEEAERNIRARMRFLAAASHDLRQPLQAMALFASALDHHVGTAQGRTIVQSLKASLRGMEEMFDQLLDMSKLDAGVMRAEPRQFLISDVLEHLEMTYGPQAEAAGLDFRVVPSSLAVVSDPRLLTRILGNFLSNAIRYTRTGKVLLGARLAGSNVRLVVCDTGPGIPEGRRLEIFREFNRGEAPPPAGRGEGSGLGLAIVQRLAMLLHHRLDLRTVEGAGSAFSVEVPLAAEEWAPLAEEEEADDARDLSGATVVVVDDDRDIQGGLEFLLEEWGCRPVVAANAVEAIQLLDRSGFSPDLVLADLHLTDGDSGMAAIAALRAHAGTHLPALVFTGDTGAASQLGAGDSVRVLLKPVDPSRLRAAMADALGR